jgi:N-acetyltransferase 10
LAENDVDLLTECITPREDLPPLLLRLSERRPERLDYLGVSYGLTQELLRFWKNCGFTPTYLRQTPNDLTGEHSNIMLKLLDADEGDAKPMWLTYFWKDFRRRAINLFGYEFRKFSPSLALSIISNKNQSKSDSVHNLTREELSNAVTPHDLKRLEAFCNNMVEYRVIMDLIPTLAKLYFLNQLGVEGRVSAMQEAILVGMGLQCKSVTLLTEELGLPQNQILGLFNRMVHKHTAALRGNAEEAIAMTIKELPTETRAPLDQSLDEELEEEAKKEKKKRKNEMKSEKFGNLEQYAIRGGDDGWAQALGDGKGSTALVSVKSGEKRKKKAGDDDAVEERENTTPSHKIKKKKNGKKGRKSVA